MAWPTSQTQEQIRRLAIEAWEYTHGNEHNTQQLFLYFIVMLLKEKLPKKANYIQRKSEYMSNSCHSIVEVNKTPET